jgi:hypothetical protein
MQGCTSISKKNVVYPIAALATLAMLSLFGGAGPAYGADAAGAAPNPSSGSNGKQQQDDEVISGPFSEYGEFDSAEDEASDEKFFQFGRFFGVGLGGGFTTATGNAGRIYQGGFPSVDFRLNYWFDFNWALQLSIQNSSHNYNLGNDGLSDVNLFRALFQVKYYIDTRDLSAPITFVGPHLIAGTGYYSRTDNIGSGNSSSTDKATQVHNAVGFNCGAGFELTLKPKRIYLDLEGLIHFVPFDDNNDTKFNTTDANSPHIPDRTGAWLTGTISLLFTW